MEKLDRSKILYILIVLVFLSVFWGWYQFKNTSGTDLVVKDAAASSDNGSESENSNDKIMVHITGAVKKPGVVTLNQGSRLVEAIDQVGGLTENADVNALNLARKVQDEEKIHVPVMGETPQSGNDPESNLISINTATLEELKSLPGVGDVIAQGIIDYREKNGGFKKLEELKNVNRIGDKIYEGLAGSITL
jgi:competence protein ComEA